MKWKTKITKIENGKEIVRERDLQEMIRGMSFSEAIFFLLKGEEAGDGEQRMMDALLVSAIDHGVGAPSATVARTVQSCGNSTHVALAAGVLALGEKHGGAIEGAAKFFVEHEGSPDVADLVASLKERKVRVPGYGHKVLEKDHRTETLFEIAKEVGIYGRYCEFAEKVGEELNNISSKVLPLNIDGAMAAILLDMGFVPELMKGFFVIARMPGLVAHVTEEAASGEGLRRIDEGDIRYEG